MKLRFKFATLAAIASLMVSPLFGQGTIVPEVSYQAVIRDADGNLIGAETPVTYNIILKIWNSPSSNDPLDLRWAEQHQTTVSAGRFAVLMGQGSVVQEGGSDLLKPALDTVFNGDSRYVEISYTSVLNNPQASDFTAIQPRQLITPAAMALRAKTAELADQATEALAVADGGVTGGSIVDGTITGDDLADASIASRHLGAGAKGFVALEAVAIDWTELSLFSQNTFRIDGSPSTETKSYETQNRNIFLEIPVSEFVPEGAKAVLCNFSLATTGGATHYSIKFAPSLARAQELTVSDTNGSASTLDIEIAQQRSYNSYLSYFKYQRVIPIYNWTFPDGTVRRGVWYRRTSSQTHSGFSGMIFGYL